MIHIPMMKYGGLVAGDIPVYEGASTIVSDSILFIPINYPADINENDILIMSIYCQNSDPFDTQTGWTLIYQENYVSDDKDFEFYWKRANGTETGTYGFSNSEGKRIFGYIARYSGCITTGTPYEGFVTSGATTDAILDIPATTSTDANRLAVALMSCGNDVNIQDVDDYTQSSEQLSTDSRDAMIAFYEQDVATAGTVSADSITIPSADGKIVAVLLLISEYI